MLEFIENNYKIIIVLVILLIVLKKIFQHKTIKLNFDNISELSFQKYARFYDTRVLKDKDFDKKIKKIYELVVKNKESNIKKIAELSGCTYDECILKLSI